MLLSTYTIKQAWLGLKKKPGFSATVITTMGVTLGALICVLTLAYLLFLQPLPYPEQDRLYKVDFSLQDELGVEVNRFYTFEALMSLYEESTTFESSSIIFYAQNVITSLPHQPTVPVAFISPEYMGMFDVPMVVGRRFDEREAVETDHQVVILSYETWQKEFNGDPNILSTRIDFKGRSYQVIGVIAEGFIEPQIIRQGVDTGVWFPWDFHLVQAKETNGNADNRWFFFGKTKAEYTEPQAQQLTTVMMEDVWQNSARRVGPATDWSVAMIFTPLGKELLGDSSSTLFFLLAGVLGLVVIACANITNLFISRTAEQQRTLAIHAALGAKKSQLLAAVFAEASVLMFAAIIFALLIASFGFLIMQTYLQGLLPRVEELAINWFTFFSAISFAVLFAGLFSFICGKMINYDALNNQLQSSGKGTGVQVSKTTRKLLIVSQVAIATVLVFANMSIFKNAYEAITLDPGFSLENTYHASFSVSAPTYPDDEVVWPLMRDLERQILSLPQVTDVDISFSPLARFFTSRGVDTRNEQEINMELRPVGEKYFEMIGQPIVEGEVFSRSDVNDSTNDAIINETLAKELAPDGSAIGLTVRFGRVTPFISKIRGVVKDIVYPGETETPNRWYFVAQGGTASKMNIKTLPGQKITRTELAEAVRAVTPLYAVYGLELLTETKEQLLFGQYTTVITTAILALVTLFLAAIGLYGILSYGTQMRRFELGTRMAIGARGRDLIGLIVKENINVILVGVVLSVLILLALYIGFKTMVASYVTLSLLPIYLTTLLAISALSLFACYWPLRRFIKQPAIYSLRGSE